MSDAFWMALFACVSSIVGAVLANRAATRAGAGARKAAVVEEKLDANTAVTVAAKRATEQVAVKADKIEKATNGERDRLLRRIADLERQLRELGDRRA